MRNPSAAFESQRNALLIGTLTLSRAKSLRRFMNFLTSLPLWICCTSQTHQMQCNSFLILVVQTFYDHLRLFLLSLDSSIHQIPFFYYLINSVIMCQILHEKLNNNGSLIYIVLESSKGIILSLVFTEAP